MNPTRQILGIKFHIAAAPALVDLGKKGGLIVVPSAPVLVELENNPALRDALLNADLAITDSGLMVLLCRILLREKITRVSGLEYLRALLADPSVKVKNSVLWVMPNILARDRLMLWLGSQAIPIGREDCYIAPKYSDGNLSDPLLLAMIESQRPAQVIMGVGGGVQERLGYYLKGSLDYRPGIHCIGGAIGFLTGDQVRIPKLADYFYLGWLFRSLSNPLRFVPRYWKARRLVGLVWRYKSEVPPLRVKRE